MGLSYFVIFSTIRSAAGDFNAQGKALADLDAATKRFDTAAATAGGGATPAPAGGGG